MYDIQYLQIIAVMIKVNLASILCSRERDEHFMQPCEGKGNKMWPLEHVPKLLKIQLE